MPIKKCNECGLPVADLYTVCPRCGARIDGEVPAADGRAADACRPARRFFSGDLRIGAWEMLFVVACNLAVVLITVNAVLGGPAWCHYPVCAAFFGYFIVFVCASGNVKRFLTRYRNAVLITNFIAAMFSIVYKAAGIGLMDWAFDYFIPANIIAGCICLLLLPLNRKINVRGVVLSLSMLFVQSAAALALMLCGVTAAGRVPSALTAVAFGINGISLIDLIFIYFVKFRNRVADTFRLWE